MALRIIVSVAALNQARREDFAFQPQEVRQTHNQARPSDRHAFFLRLRALPPFISRMRTFAMPSHRLCHGWLLRLSRLCSDRRGHSVPLPTLALAPLIPYLKALFIVLNIAKYDVSCSKS